MKRTVMFLMLLFVLALTLGAQPAAPAPPVAPAPAAQERTPVDEWMYWQEHYDELERLASQPEDVSPVVKKDHGVSSEINECWSCLPVEVTRELCYCYDVGMADTWAVGCPPPGYYVDCGVGSAEFMRETVAVELGFKKAIIAANYTPSTVMSGHSSSFQAWWNNYVEAPSGSGSSGPSSSYTTTISGYTSAANSYTTSQQYTDYGFPYTLKSWSCYLSGNECSRESSINGTN